MKDMVKILSSVLFVLAYSSIAQEASDSGKSQEAVVVTPSKAWVSSVNHNKFATPKAESGSEKSRKDLKQISKNIQRLKSDVIRLNKDLRDMEEKLLFPSNTRFSVFVSLSTGQFFRLESVKLKLDGKLVATHLFSQKQRESMSRGGIHRLYVTNLNEGDHSATAFFTGVDINGRALKRASTVEFEKGIGSEYLELAVIDDGSTQEAKFEMKRW